MGRIHFELLTPTEKLVDREVDEVRVPGGAGGFGVRAGHAGLLSTLGVGTLLLIDGERRERFVLEGGFIEVSPDKVLVLAAAATPEAKIDTGAAKAEIEEALAALAGEACASAAYAKASARLERARAHAAL